MTTNTARRTLTLVLIATAALMATPAAQAGGFGFGGFSGGMGGGGGRLMNQLYRGSSGNSSRYGNSYSPRSSGNRYSSSKPYPPPVVQSYPSTTSTYPTYPTNGYPTTRVPVAPTVVNQAKPVVKVNPIPVAGVTGSTDSVIKRSNDLARTSEAVTSVVTKAAEKVGEIKKLDPSKIGNVVASGMPGPQSSPSKPIDPGIGNGNPPAAGVQPPKHPAQSTCGTKPAKPGSSNWKWVGVTMPVVVATSQPTRPTVINNNTTVIEQTIVQAPAAQAVPTAPSAASAPDLKLESVALVDQGSVTAGSGPTYRVLIRNVSTADVADPFTVTLVAAKEDRSFDGETPRTDESVISLAAGQEKTLDVRLPVEALTCETDPSGKDVPFATLLVLVDGYAKLTESNRDNNAAAIARNEIEAILPIVASAETVAANGQREVNVAGQSFGADQGKVMLDLGTVRVPAEVVTWEANTIRAKLPEVETAASVTTRLVVVRADGTAAEPFDLTPTDVAAR